MLKDNIFFCKYPHCILFSLIHFSDNYKMDRNILVNISGGIVIILGMDKTNWDVRHVKSSLFFVHYLHSC